MILIVLFGTFYLSENVYSCVRFFFWFVLLFLQVWMFCAHLGYFLSIFQAGDRVFTTSTVAGGYAEFTVAANDSVYKLPDNLDFTQGAAIGIPYFTAYRALVHK